MTENRRTALKIPAEFRREIVDNNYFYKAVITPGDPHMGILVIIYQTYLCPSCEKIDINNPCLKCLGTVYDVFKVLLPEIVELEKQAKLLQML